MASKLTSQPLGAYLLNLRLRYDNLRLVQRHKVLKVCKVVLSISETTL